MPAASAEPGARGDGDDEAAWIAAARRGDRTAFAKIVARHQSNVRRQLRHHLRGDAATADELAQDTFVLAWRGLVAFRGDARVATWLHRIAHRRFLMHARAATSRIDVVSSDDDERPERADIGTLDADAAMRLDVERALADLPDAQRQAVFHCFHLDLSHEEAAAVLGWPLGTLKSHVARAKATLRRRLAAWAPGNEATT